MLTTTNPQQHQQQQQSTSHRPVPLMRRDDLVTETIDYQGVPYCVVKDPIALKYHRLQPEQYHLLTLLDGGRSLEELRDEVQVKFPSVSWTLHDLQSLVGDLHTKKLAYSLRFGQGGELRKLERKEKRKQLVAKFSNLLYLRLPGWDPSAALRFLYPLFFWMFRPWAVIGAAVFVTAAMIWLGVHFDHFVHSLPEFQQFFGWPNLIYLWCTLAIAKIIHEFGHGLTCHHFRGECHEMGIMLLVFSPTLYCDVSDSWMMRNKWHRIWIAGAGMYIEGILSAIALFVWWNTSPGLTHHLALNIFFVTTVTTVVFNANPLMRLDGYYMLADYMEIPNLRQKADRMFQETFGKVCFGIEPQPDPFMPDRGKGWFLFYAFAAAIYRWVVILGIALFLYTVLKPYKLQSIGIAAAVVSIGGILGRMVYTTGRMLLTPRQKPLSRPRMFITVAAAIALLAAIALVPIPFYIEAPFLIQPHKVRHVMTMTPGHLEEILVQPGQRVSAGDVIARLVNEEREDELRRLIAEQKLQAVKREQFHLADQPTRRALAEAHWTTLDEQIQELRKQLDELTVRAPIDGVIVEPPEKPEPSLEAVRDQLSDWYGSPLSEVNLGASLETRTHLASIAPDEQMEAILFFDQASRDDVYLNQTVRIRFDHLPHTTYTGHIESISLRHDEYAPEALSNKSGGSIATVTDAQGREKLISVAYQATVLLQEDRDLMMPGLRGRARFLISKRSAGHWLWRYLNRTFLFRL